MRIKYILNHITMRIKYILNHIKIHKKTQAKRRKGSTIMPETRVYKKVRTSNWKFSEAYLPLR